MGTVKKDGKPSFENSNTNKQGQRFTKTQFYNKMVRFEGACTKLKGQVFEIQNTRPSQVLTYKKSLEEIATYLGTVYGPMIQSTVESKQEPTINEPMPTEIGLNSTITRADKIRFENLYDQYILKKGKIKSQIKKHTISSSDKHLKSLSQGLKISMTTRSSVRINILSG